MKMSKIKKIIVKCQDFWTDEIEIDSDVFDDVYIEAATRAVESRINLPDFKLTVMLVCWEKKNFSKPEKHFGYNTYQILINGAFHNKAEVFRQNCIKLNGLDMKKENLKGNNAYGNPTNGQPNSGSLGE